MSNNNTSAAFKLVKPRHVLRIDTLSRCRMAAFSCETWNICDDAVLFGTKAGFGRGCTFERPSSPMSDSTAYIREGNSSLDSKLDNRSCKSQTKSSFLTNTAYYLSRVLSILCRSALTFLQPSFVTQDLFRSSEQHVCNIHCFGRLSVLAGSSTTSRQTSARERSGLSAEGTS